MFQATWSNDSQTIAHKGSRPISEAGSSSLFLSAAWKSIITWSKAICEVQVLGEKPKREKMISQCLKLFTMISGDNDWIRQHKHTVKKYIKRKIRHQQSNIFTVKCSNLACDVSRNPTWCTTALESVWLRGCLARNVLKIKWVGFRKQGIER